MIRDDAISSWARVILAVDWTAAIRRLTSRSCAAMPATSALPLLDLGLRAPVLLDRLLSDVGRVHGLDRLVLHQQLAGAGLEPLLEVLDRVLERGHHVVGQPARLPDRVQDARPGTLQVVEELPLEAA